MAMASLFISSSPSFTLSPKTYTKYHTAYFLKPFSIKASFTSVDQQPTISLADKQPFPFKANSWQWKFQDKFLTIYYEEHGKESPEPTKNILMLPSISDVSTVEEWRSVAGNIVQRVGKINWRAVIVDWPGLGYSDRPKLDYNVDVMEKFLTDFVSAPDSPMMHSGKDLVVFGGGACTHNYSLCCKEGSAEASSHCCCCAHLGWSSSYCVWSRFHHGNEVPAAKGQLKDPRSWLDDLLIAELPSQNEMGARFAPAAFLTGLLDPVQSQEEFLELFADLDGKVPALVLSTKEFSEEVQGSNASTQRRQRGQ
ncbi:hypothetical protein OIU84_028742 [Salix udensis]|uniref:AB hydrolase-1 domain-containing protein n=1 Tax=Salix udensis TaxID=889485 RepID=A0AAD6P9B5_9ROSI|nr:hypothetical protein OIU84_028742 [Salix udensis]